MNLNQLPRRVVVAAMAALVGAALVVSAPPAGAAVDPISQRPPPPPEWLATWLDDLAEQGGLTPELVSARTEYQWRTAVDAALAYAAGLDAGVERWRPLVELYFRQGDVDWALRIMRCESGGDPHADNPRSSASGLFQHLARLWPERAPRAGFGDRDVFDPEANVAVAAWLLYRGGGKSHWTCKA